MQSWDQKSEISWEHLTEIGTFLNYKKGVWVLICNGREIGRIVRPSNPFEWAENIIVKNKGFWGES